MDQLQTSPEKGLSSHRFIKVAISEHSAIDLCMLLNDTVLTTDFNNLVSPNCMETVDIGGDYTRIWRRVVVFFFKTLSRHWYGQTEARHVDP